MQQYSGIYLLQNHSTWFGCPSHPSSGVHKTVTAASGTGHSVNLTPLLLLYSFGFCKELQAHVNNLSFSLRNQLKFTQAAAHPV